MFPSDTKVFYVTRDIERALGIAPHASFHIVSNKNPQSQAVFTQYPEFVTLLESFDGQPMDTAALMEHPDAIQLMPHGSRVMVFKNTPQIETIAARNGWELLNPAASLAETVENKITQIEWLGDDARAYLPPHEILLTKDARWTGTPFILQWAHGHTGGTTILITSEKDLDALKEKFPERMMRKTAFIQGPSFTVNAVIADSKVLIGNVSYQITGLPPFTDSPFSTIGNDWALTHSLLNEQELDVIETMVGVIGHKLGNSGWKGLFGVDIIRDDERNTIHLIEINARQPASTTFETFLQNEFLLEGVRGITTFETHLRALLGMPVNEHLISINDGAQIVLRVGKKTNSVRPETIAALEAVGYTVLTYANTTHNADLIRIQSSRGIMETHNTFNERGKEIEAIISRS